jgi:hypothetical protein
MVRILREADAESLPTVAMRGRKGKGSGPFPDGGLGLPSSALLQPDKTDSAADIRPLKELSVDDRGMCSYPDYLK